MKKDIEWLKEKVEEMYTHYSISNNFDFVSKREAITEISNLIDQLDEPEIEEKYYTFDNFKKWIQDNGEEVQRMIGEIYEEPTEIKRGLEAGGVSVAEMTQILEKVDIINEPSHYKGRHGLEAIEVVRNFGNDDMVAGFYWGNAIKYMTRYRNKNGLEDLKKARKNLDWLIEHMEEEK